MNIDRRALKHTEKHSHTYTYTPSLLIQQLVKLSLRDQFYSLYTGDSCDRLLKIQLIIHRIRPLIDGRKKEPFNRRFNRPTLTAC